MSRLPNNLDACKINSAVRASSCFTKMDHYLRWSSIDAPALQISTGTFLSNKQRMVTSIFRLSMTTCPSNKTRTRLRQMDKEILTSFVTQIIPRMVAELMAWWCKHAWCVCK